VSDRPKQTWFRRAVFAGAVVVTSAVAIGATTGTAAAQLYPTYSHQYDNPYHRHEGSNRDWHRGWSDHGRGHGEWGHGDRDHAGRDHQGWSGSSQSGRAAVQNGARATPGGAVGNYLGALGAHYR
jgi:hypothetical protein